MRLATHTRKMHLEKWHPVVVYMGVEKHAKHEKTTVSVTLSKAYCGKTFHKFNWEQNAISDCLLWRDFAVKNVKKFLGGPRAWWFDWVLGATTSLWQGHFGPLVVSTCHCSLAASNIIPISPNLPPAGNRMTRSKFCAATCELLIFHNSARWPPLSSSVYFWQVSISFKRKGNPKRAICRGSHRPDIVVSESCAFFSRFPAHRHGKRKKKTPRRLEKDFRALDDRNRYVLAGQSIFVWRGLHGTGAFIKSQWPFRSHLSVKGSWLPRIARTRRRKKWNCPHVRLISGHRCLSETVFGSSSQMTCHDAEISIKAADARKWKQSNVHFNSKTRVFMTLEARDQIEALSSLTCSSVSSVGRHYGKVQKVHSPNPFKRNV